MLDSMERILKFYLKDQRRGKQIYRDCKIHCCKDVDHKKATGTELALPQYTTRNLGKRYETTVFRHCDNRQGKTDLREKENK